MKPIKFETLKKKLAAADLNFDDVSYIDEHGTLINALMVNHDYEGYYPTRDALTAHNTAANIAHKAGYKATSRGNYNGTLITYRDGEQPTPATAPTGDEPAADPEPEQPAEPKETAQEKTDRENREHCERIAKELDSIAEGNCYRCPHCGEVIEWDDDQYNDGDAVYTCPECGETFEENELEPYTLWDCFDDVYDIEYSISGNMEYRSVRLMVACGGPNIYIDTGTKSVELYWWTDRASYRLLSDTCKEIDSIFEEYFTCNR